jgi:hypothetical protein
MKRYKSWLEQILAPFFEKVQGHPKARRAKKLTRRLVLETLEDRTLPAVSLPGAPTWVDQGPGPMENGNNVIIPAQNNPQVGAVHAIAIDTTNPNRVFIASVNGGIWRSDTATYSRFDGVNNDGEGATDEADENPSWVPVSDQLPTLSLGSLALSPLDPARNTLFAGSGRFSNGFADGGPLLGMFRSTDGGGNWGAIGGTTFDGVTIERILPTTLGGALATQTVLAATSNGVYRSTNGGGTWNLISGSAGNTDGIDNDADGNTDEVGELNLPNGYSTDVVPDPGNVNRFYAGINNRGVFRSDDGGATWRAVNTGITGIGGESRIELSVSAAAGNPVYVGLVSGAGVLNNVFRSANQGGNWAVLGAVPNTNPGGQGGFNFSIVADPVNNNIVFVAGDRGTANNAGNIFRGDSNTNTWVSLASPNAGGTAPHPDSRDMVFSFVPDGVGGTVATILEADDGGLYRLRQPNGAGVWDSVLGNMRPAEFWSVAYDAFNKRLFGGTQDNGNPEQTATGSLLWRDRLGGDGAIVQVEYRDTNNDGTLDLSNRYMSRQNFGGFTRVQYDAGNPNGLATTVALTVQGTGGRSVNGAGTLPFGNPVARVFDNTRQFVNPHIINAVAPNRIMIGTSFLYESFDQGTNVIALGGLNDLRTNGIDEDGDGNPANDPDEWSPANPVGAVRTMAYGGRLNGANAPDVAYVGTNGGTVNGVPNSRLLLRTAIATAGSPVLGDFTTLTNYPGAIPNDIVLDSDNWQRGYVVDNNGQVFRFVNAGAAAADWTNITGNLGNFFTAMQTADPSVPSLLRTVELFTPTAAAGDDVVLVGGQGGVYRTLNPEAGAAAMWTEFGNTLPNALASDLRYDRRDDVLLVGTRGRGAWTIGSASDTLQVVSVLQIDGDTDFDGQDDIIRLIRNAANPSQLEVYLNSPVPTMTVPLASLQQINVRGFGGNDTLIVDSSNGLINVPGGIRYDGGTGADQLTLQQTGGPTHTSATYTLGNIPGSGIHTIVGTGAGNVQTVSFETLEPVLDLVPAATLTVNATPTDNAINYSAGLLVTQGLVTVDEHESIQFANKGTLIINALAGADTINLNNSNTAGLSGITVNGGDPTSGDTLIVNGTAATLTVATGTSTITGAGPVGITYATIEALTVNAGPSTTLAVTGSASYTYTPGSAADAGAVQTDSLPIAFTGVGAGETLSLSGTSAVINGTAANDTFTVAATTGNVAFIGRLTVARVGLTALTLNGLDGDDTFNVTGPQSYTSILLAGGDPSASDVANVTGNGTAVAVNNLGGATANITGGGLGTVSLPSVEILNLSAGAGGITLNGTAAPDAFVVTPTGANTAIAQVGSVAPVVNTTNTGGLTVDAVAASDTLAVNATSGADTIAVSGSAVTVTGLKTVNYANVEGLTVKGLAGSDIFNVTPSATVPIFIDGGDPVGVLPGDLLNIVAGGQTVTLNPGPETDEGGINVGANQTVSYDHIESISITGPGSAIINGTNGPDTITIIARDASTHDGADGIQDFTVSVNTGPEILFINTPSLLVNALSGADLINLRTPAPNNAEWDVNVTIDGGPPSAGEPSGADRVVVETPGAAAETALYAPTASDGGTLDITNLSSLVTLIRIEELLYDGEADNDSLTTTALGGPDTIIHTPGANDQAGTFQVNALLPISYQNMGSAGILTADGLGGPDTLIYNGTAANDAFVVGTAGQVNLNSRLAVNTASIDVLTLEGLAGDDAFTLVPAISASPYATINFNGGSQASAAGDKTNLIGTAGADIVHVSGQVVTSAGKVVASSGVEEINLDLLGDTDELIYDGVSGVSEAINVISSGIAGGGQFSVPGVTLVNFNGAELIDVNGNTPAPSDTDTVTFTGTNAVDVVQINLAADGTTADPILQLQNAALATLLTLRNYTNFATLNVKTLDGLDTVNVYTDASGPSRNLFVDGGVPSGKKRSTDNLNIFYTPPRPRIIHSAETQDPDNGLVDLDYGTARFVIQYDEFEQVVIRRV